MEQPNILWICTDQQRFDTLGCYGNEFVHTPNIDRLAENGVLFENAFSQSTVCTPSRASFLTGRYPRTTRCRQNGQSIPKDEVLITKLLADAGYTCGLSGKLHLAACNPEVAPEKEARIDDGYSEFNWSHHPKRDWDQDDYHSWLTEKEVTYATHLMDECPYIEHGPDEENHQTTWCAEKAINFIRKNADTDQPWLFSVNIFDPHHPFDPPKDYFNRYTEILDDLPLPNYADGELDSKTTFQQIDTEGGYGIRGNYPYSKMTNRDHRMITAAYYAMVDLIDKQVGRMIEALEESGQLEKTIVIFMSDHGEMLGDHGIYLKGPHFYEGAVHVPLIISCPTRFQTNKRVDTLVELVDLTPTILETVGLPGYGGIQGKSLLHLINYSDPLESHRNDIYSEFYDAAWPHNGEGALATMLRTKKEKIILYHGKEFGELYDLKSDPKERINLWDDVNYQLVKLQLMKKLCDRMAETIDPLPEREAIW